MLVQSRPGLVEVRWVYVHDLSGTHRDEYFYSTDTTLTAQEVLEEYTGRWNVETTFEEARAVLGPGEHAGLVRENGDACRAVLVGVVQRGGMMYWLLPAEDQDQGSVEWEGKQSITFSDAITAVRRWLWTHWVFPQAGHAEAFEKLPEAFQRSLLYALAPAA